MNIDFVLSYNNIFFPIQLLSGSLDLHAVPEVDVHSLDVGVAAKRVVSIGRKGKIF
jgi:hypothetical protein